MDLTFPCTLSKLSILAMFYCIARDDLGWIYDSLSYISLRYLN